MIVFYLIYCRLIVSASFGSLDVYFLESDSGYSLDTPPALDETDV